jgi:hypothetical protein
MIRAGAVEQLLWRGAPSPRGRRDLPETSVLLGIRLDKADYAASGVLQISRILQPENPFVSTATIRK